MSVNEDHTAGSRYSETSPHLDSNLSYQAFLSQLAQSSKLKTLDSLILENNFTLDGPTIISEFALSLAILGVPGPCGQVEWDVKTIGVGAHFSVSQSLIWDFAEVKHGESRGNLSQLAAIKKPNFLLDVDRELDLSETRNSSRHVRSMMLEITALCHPRLRQHPNIVDLLSWGFDNIRNWHSVPFIALELAYTDLAILLQDEISTTEKLNLMDNIACGLDAIHEVGLIHGDLKPANVLVFARSDGWYAKLADFAGASMVDRNWVCEGGGTVGWRAPEIRDFYELGKALDFSVFDRADCYSFGLVAWSTFFRSKAESPQEEIDADVEQIALKDLDASHEQMPASLVQTVKLLFSSVLQAAPGSRTAKLGWIFNDCTEEGDQKDQVQLDEPTAENFYHEYPDSAQIDFNLPEIDMILVPALVTAFEKKGDLPSRILHALIVKFLSSVSDLDVDLGKREVLLNLLCAAARQGQGPAKAIIFRIYEYLGLTPPFDIMSSRLCWIAESCSKGNFFLWSELQQIDADVYAESIWAFRTSGGFNHPYTTLVSFSQEDDADSESKISAHPDQGNPLHAAATSTVPSVLSKIMDCSDPGDVNMRNAFGETPLHMACKAGLVDNVLLLLSYGADASLEMPHSGPGCLHWVFQFNAGDVERLIDVLIKHGSAINLRSKQKIAIPCPPFSLPLGTALHWAVEMSAPEAVSALLQYGADPCLRDGTDPYKYDDYVRQLDFVQPPDRTEFSIPGHPTMGLNAFDIAIKNRDHEILHILLSKTSIPGIADLVDEEHYAAVHRLAGEYRLRTRQAAGIWKRYLKGSRQKQKNGTALTVRLLRDHKFDLSRLAEPQPIASDRNSPIHVTPLMMAVRYGDIDLAEALLQYGASVDVCNDRGETALHCIGGERCYGFENRQSDMINVLLQTSPNINAQASDGDSPLALAARRGHREVAFALLSSGADFCVRCGTSDGRGRGQNVLAVLCTCDIKEAEKTDEWMVMVFTRFVLPCMSTSDAALHVRIQQQVFTEAGANGGNFLHFAAEYWLPKCSRLLLEGGLVDINQLRGTRKLRRRNGVLGVISGFRTPLDEASKRAKLLKRVYGHEHSAKDFHDLMLNFDETVQIIQTHGGVKASTMRPKIFKPGITLPTDTKGTQNDI